MPRRPREMPRWRVRRGGRRAWRGSSTRSAPCSGRSNSLPSRCHRLADTSGLLLLSRADGEHSLSDHRSRIVRMHWAGLLEIGYRELAACATGTHLVNQHECPGAVHLSLGAEDRGLCTGRRRGDDNGGEHDRVALDCDCVPRAALRSCDQFRQERNTEQMPLGCPIRALGIRCHWHGHVRMPMRLSLTSRSAPRRALGAHHLVGRQKQSHGRSKSDKQLSQSLLWPRSRRGGRA
jgi:hypothetical protein